MKSLVTLLESNTETTINEALSKMEIDVLKTSLITGATDFKHGNIKIDELEPLFDKANIQATCGEIADEYAENEEGFASYGEARTAIMKELQKFANDVALKKFGYVNHYMIAYFCANHMEL